MRLAAVAAVAATPSPAAGQEALLERWTLGPVAEGWSPRWTVPEEPAAPGASPRVRLHATAGALRLGTSLDQTESSAKLDLRQAVSAAFALRLTASSDAHSARTGGRPLLETRRSQAIGGGLEVEERLGALGLLRMSALAGWDGGAGGEGRLTLTGARHLLAVRGWRVRGRASRIFLPADSLREVGVGELAIGFGARASAGLPAGPLTLRASGSLEVERLHEDGAPRDDGAFLATSPAGASRTYETSLHVGWGPWGLGGAHRRRDLDLESTLFRSGISAGRLFRAALDVRRWSVAGQHAGSGGRWSLEVAAERVEGNVSTRLETWPFVDLWSTLSVQAYRLRGDLQARSASLEVARAPSGAIGWGGSLGAARLRVSTDRESWFVTSFGFGRTGREATRAGVDAAIVLTSSVSRSLALAGGVARLQLEGGVPVHVDAPAGAAGGSRSDDDLAGYAAISLAWVR